MYTWTACLWTTYVLVAAQSLEPAVLLHQRSSVFLPLGGQMNHPLHTGLHHVLRGGAECECSQGVSGACRSALRQAAGTWSCSRLLSASGMRSTVFFFTCIRSCFSEFFSSLCFNSSSTCRREQHTLAVWCLLALMLISQAGYSRLAIHRVLPSGTCV